MASEDKEEVEDEITPTHKEMEQHIELKRNQYVTDDVVIERLNTLIKEHKRKDKENCKKCEELKLEVDYVACNFKRHTDEMLINMQCGEMLHSLTRQEETIVRKKVEEEAKVQ